MKFNVAKMEICTVEAGHENEGNKYVKMLLQPQDIFDPKTHTVCMFVNQELIPAYTTLSQDLTKVPAFNGSEEIVDNLPPFNFKDSKTGALIQPARTSMSVFVRINADGKLAEDPRTLAVRTIKQLGKFVETSNDPIEAPAPPVTAPVAEQPPVVAPPVTAPVAPTV
jgi:hypothetical protein